MPCIYIVLYCCLAFYSFPVVTGEVKSTEYRCSTCVLHVTGAHIVGTNCHFDAEKTLKTIKLMKEALEREGFNNTYLMTQPLAYWTNDCNKQGFIDLPEFPFGKS